MKYTRPVVQWLCLTAFFILAMYGGVSNQIWILLIAFVFYCIGVLVARPRNDVRSVGSIVAVALFITSIIYHDSRLSMVAMPVLFITLLLADHRTRLSVTVALVVAGLIAVGVVLNDYNIALIAILAGGAGAMLVLLDTYHKPKK